MLERLLNQIEEQKRDGAINRDEFDIDYEVSGWPVLSAPEKRQQLERYVLRKCIPERHRFKKADGSDGIVYFDSRGRAVHGSISEVSDADLVRMAKSAGKRFRGQADPNKPSTGRKNHGYSYPVQEDLDESVGLDESRMGIRADPTVMFSDMKQAVTDLLAARGSIRKVHTRLKKIAQDASGVTWTGNYNSHHINNASVNLYNMDMSIGNAVNEIESLANKMQKMVVK